MKITVEFANLDEFKQYMGIESPSLLAQAPKEAADAPAPAPAETVQEPQEVPEAHAPEKNTKKAEKATPAEAEAPAEDAAAEEAPATVTEDFRIVVRKQLAALNKKCGYNRAAELIKELTGKNKLTEVNLADLPKVMDHAKEETNAD